MKKLQSGFTLLELVIVVVIVGILAAIAIPQYQNYTARAQASEALSLASGAKAAVAEYANTNSAFAATADCTSATDCNAAYGLEIANTIKGKYVSQVEVAAGTGAVLATFGTGADSKLSGGVMALTPTNNSGSISWVCSSTGSPDITNYIPSSCK